MIRPVIKDGLHARNRFRKGYDFQQLASGDESLSRFVSRNEHGDLSIDYANPQAVLALNRALLQQMYGIQAWGLPEGYLCPAVPGRSDYVHHLADLIAEPQRGALRTTGVSVIDIGTGASCVYPLIGASEHGWHVVATDVDRVAVQWASRIVAANPASADRIDCRLQRARDRCFAGVVRRGERFDASMCNPPFHASAEEAGAGSLRKRRNLGATAPSGRPLNFGGAAHELWCDGGELAFVRNMIAESATMPALCRWFTTLVSKSAHLPRLLAAVRDVQATSRVIEMAHGQKKTRILAWTFVGA